MALSAGNKALAEDFINLKARVKAEMSRRKNRDSLTAYAGAEYDYTIIPSEGGQILVEHINKIVEPINAIKATGFESVQNAGAPIKALDALDIQLTAHEEYPIRGKGTDCAAGCSGLCTNACSGTCTGCSGCTGCTGCSGSCEGSCSGSCSGTCTGGCTGGCSDYCTGECRKDCTDVCAYSTY